MPDKKLNCILIPGGGLLENGELPEWTIARLETGFEYKDQTDWYILLSGGTVHKPPPLDQEGYPLYESRKAAEFLIRAGISPGRILTEISSYDTIGNAYFARMLFTDPLSLNRCLIITSEFHMARTQAIFEWIFSLNPLQHDYKLSFASTSNRGLSTEILEARQKREKQSLDRLEETIQQIPTVLAFNKWIYSEHAAYSTKKSKDTLSNEDLGSY
jgi:hypothetical protein